MKLSYCIKLSAGDLFTKRIREVVLKTKKYNVEWKFIMLKKIDGRSKDFVIVGENDKQIFLEFTSEQAEKHWSYVSRGCKGYYNKYHKVIVS